MAQRLVDPVGLWITGLDAWRVVLQAQTVVGLRMLGMMGLWAVAPTETRTMVAEKPTASAWSATGATLAAANGKRPDRIAAAALRPIGARTRSNVVRLAKRGPKVPKGSI